MLALNIRGIGDDHTPTLWAYTKKIEAVGMEDINPADLGGIQDNAPADRNQPDFPPVVPHEAAARLPGESEMEFELRVARARINPEHAQAAEARS